MLQYNPYEDQTQNDQTFPQLAEELEPTTDVGDHHTGAEILLPRWDKMARGHIVTWSCDDSRNVMCRAHPNLILGTRSYQVEFAGGKVTELITNFIAESMYD